MKTEKTDLEGQMNLFEVLDEEETLKESEAGSRRTKGRFLSDSSKSKGYVCCDAQGI